jgi:hypothetical protein
LTTLVYDRAVMEVDSALLIIIAASIVSSEPLKMHTHCRAVAFKVALYQNCGNELKDQFPSVPLADSEG